MRNKNQSLRVQKYKEIAPKVFCRIDIQFKLHTDTVFDRVLIAHSEALKLPFLQVLLERRKYHEDSKLLSFSLHNNTWEVNYRHE